MPEFTDEQITQLAQYAEQILATELSAIVERFSVATTIGNSEYSLPSNIHDVKKVLWKGFKLEGARDTSDLILSGSTPLSSTPGYPREYKCQYVGVPVLKLFPSPSEALPLGTGDLWGESAVRSSLIIEAAVIPDFTSSSIRIPSFVRRQYVKDYVIYRLLKREGKLMDQKAAQYFMQKFEFDKVEHRLIQSQLFSAIPLDFETTSMYPHRVLRPVLPPQFGEVCE